jgi:hypothetical protein
VALDPLGVFLMEFAGLVLPWVMCVMPWVMPSLGDAPWLGDALMA